MSQEALKAIKALQARLDEQARFLRDAESLTESIASQLEELKEAIKTGIYDELLKDVKPAVSLDEQERERIRELPKCSIRDFLLPVVCEAFDVTEFQVLGRDRHLATQRPRAALCVAMRLQNMSYTSIGKAMDLDHSTVMHHCNKHSEKLREDVRYRKGVEIMKRRIATVCGTLPTTDKLQEPLSRRCEECSTIFTCHYLDQVKCDACSKVTGAMAQLDNPRIRMI